MSALAATAALAIVTNGLLAGLFFAFACAVSPALGRLPDAAYVGAFQSINTTILNGTFLTVFFAAPATAVAAAALSGTAPRPTTVWLVLGAVCSLATFIVTVAANVPLNRALDAASVRTPAEHAAARESFEAPWNRWNVVRTITGAAALACLGLAHLA